MPYISNLPANLTILKDGGLQFRKTSNTQRTRSVLILGFATDGPLEPTAVDSNTVKTVFGKDVDSNGIKNGGTITTAVESLEKLGCTDIRAMRISGETSKAVLKSLAKNEVKLIKHEEVLGVVDSNDETTLTLSKERIIKDTIKIFVKDRPLSSMFEFTEATKQLVIPAGVTEAGASVTVKYEYMGKQDVETSETLTAATESSNVIVTLTEKPTTTNVTVIVNGEILPESRYTVNAQSKKITFNSVVSRGKEAKTIEVVEGTQVTVRYTTSRDVKLSFTDKANGSTKFVTATSLQELVLAETPKSETVRLYCNEQDVPLSYFTVSGKTISVKKEKLTRNRTLSCTYLVEKQVDTTTTISLESFFAGNVYNDGKVSVIEILNNSNKVIGKKIVIEKPESKRTNVELPLEYSSLNYSTYGEMVNAINNDMRGGVYRAYTDFPDELVSNLQISENQFDGGDSGLNLSKDQIKECLSGKRDKDGYLIKEGIYQTLESYKCDYVFLDGVYADDDDQLSSKESFDYDLALFCASLSHKVRITYGVMSVKPCKNTSMAGIKEYVDRLSNFNKDGTRYLLKNNGKIYLDQEGKPIDLGRYIRICGGAEPMIFNEDLGVYPCNPALAYIGLQSSLPPHITPMNKEVSSARGLRFVIQENQVKSLARANIIAFSLKTTAQRNSVPKVYCFDSMTCAAPNSDYVRTANCEIVKLIGDDIKEIGDPYIGDVPTTENKNSLSAALSKRFSSRVESKEIQQYYFELIEDSTMKILGQSRIKVMVVPYGERRGITAELGLSPS